MEIRMMTGRDVLAAIDAVAAIYRAAFAGEPYNRNETEVAEFARALPLHTQREGFRCFVALDGAGRGLAGFVYGYRSRPGQWWYDNVARALGAHETTVWLGDAFQVTELAVIPAEQRRGIGGALHDALLHDLLYPRAVLSTLDAETPGRILYRGRGWQDLLSGFYFPSVPRRYAIMGRTLPDFGA